MTRRRDSRHRGLHVAGAGEGAGADKRSDLWSFGCVVYEMLTGRRAFDGDDVSETLAAVIKRRCQSGQRCRVMLPAAVRTLLRDCLQKDPASGRLMQRRWCS